MDPRHIHFVVTPWRNSQDLFQLRQHLYGSDITKKERAVNKILAWRSRKQDGLPLLLDSTADIVDVILQDGKHGLNHNALRLLYATALSRFITGLADTQIDLTRDKPSWFPQGKSLQLPVTLLELRHRIVHRHLPSLAELKRGAQASLDWLWEWYWSQLDHAFGVAAKDETDLEGTHAIREKLQAILKAYIRDRKSEIKTKKKLTLSSQTAIHAYTLRYSPATTCTPPSRLQNTLLTLLITDKMILPTDKKLGSSMSGAFLIWDPFLLALCDAVLPLSSLVNALLDVLLASPADQNDPQNDPIKEAQFEWIAHILTSEAWSSVRQGSSRLAESALESCFAQPGYWGFRLVDAVLGSGCGVKNEVAWRDVSRAARGEGDLEKEGSEDVDVDMDMDGGEVQELPVRSPTTVKEKSVGPRKVFAWRARPIGWLDGEVEDE